MKKNTWLVLILLTLGIIFWIYQNISLPQLAAWDEVGYIWQAWQFRKAVKVGDWLSFWQLTKNNVQFPFFQDWYLALATLFLDYGVSSTRLVSLILFLPTVLLIDSAAR